MPSTAPDGSSGPAPSPTPRMSTSANTTTLVLDPRVLVPASPLSSPPPFPSLPSWEAAMLTGLTLITFPKFAFAAVEVGVSSFKMSCYFASLKLNFPWIWSHSMVVFISSGKLY